jgi:hypothetical protein
MIAKYSLAALSLPALFGASLALIACSAAVADMDVGKEVETAAKHAGLAAGSKDLKTAQMHLHHTINCIVGPQGNGFDASRGNPCKDLGSGAIPDTQDAAKKKSLRQALTKANAGLKLSDLAAAQNDAQEAQGLIQKAM